MNDLESFNVPGYYRKSPLRVRLHVAGRWRLFPFSKLRRYLPDNGTIVDIGCGYGHFSLYAAALKPDSIVWGLDSDQEKINLAKEIVKQNNIPNVAFVAGLVGDYDLPEADLVTIIDVMYLIPPHIQESILEIAARRLKTGGRLLVKEMSHKPAWKFNWNRMEEWLAVSVFRITQGNGFYFRTDEEWQRLLERFDLRAASLRLDQGLIHPHILHIGEKA